MTSAANKWTWHEQYGDHYCVVNDASGRPGYVWFKETQEGSQAAAQRPAPAHESSAESYHHQPDGQAYAPPGSYLVQYRSTQGHPRQQYQVAYHGQSSSQQGAVRHRHRRGDSASLQEPDSNAPHMPPPVPPNVRQTLPDLISGTPQQGWYESLDQSYRMRTGREAHQFFKRGRVFSMLWAEAASETAARQANNGDGTVQQFHRTGYTQGYTQGRFGETVFSNIRRFVIMRVKRHDHFVYACPITTYSGRGTTKQGCRPSEHAIVYFSGTTPRYVEGEYGNGMTTDPIEIVPADRNATMDPASRLRFGKTFPVEWNVKVKEIGRVASHDMAKMIQYWQEEDFFNDSDDAEGE